MSNIEKQESEVRTPRTPRARQLEIIKQNITALERIGHTYAARRQREFLAQLETKSQEGSTKGVKR